MNLYDEFFAIVQEFQKESVEYAVIGGIAMAIHDLPRFTRDIDLLINPDQIGHVRMAMKRLDYFEAARPWTFRNTQLTLYRFMKTEGEDYLTVDVLAGPRPEHKRIVDSATERRWAEGRVKVATKEDIIWLKEQRGSDQDKVDIRNLGNDKSRESDQARQ